jgi:hypothetical protein
MVHPFPTSKKEISIKTAPTLLPGIGHHSVFFLGLSTLMTSLPA